MHRQRDEGVSEVVAEILIVALVIALAAIIAGIVFGVVVVQPKSADIPPTVGIVNNEAGQPRAISLYSRGGDTAYLDRGDGVQYALGIYVDTQEESYRADPDDDVSTFSPGQTLYVYWDDPKFRITGDLASVNTTLPPIRGTLRIVDENARLLVYKEGLATGGSVTASPTTACILGTGWIITNPNNFNVEFRLIYQPGSIVVREDEIQALTRLIVWSPYYQETGGSPHRIRVLSEPYKNQQTSVKTTSKSWCQFSDISESIPLGSPGMLMLDPYN